MTLFQTNTTASADPLASLRSWEPKTVVPQYETAQGYRDAEGVGQVVYRNDTGQALGVVGPRYTVVPHSDLCALFDALRERNVLRDVRCGEFAGGAKVWIQGRPSEGGELQVIPGHVLQHNLTVADGHDGSISLALVDTATNIVCRNTFQRAHKTGKGLRLRHTGSVADRFREAVQAIYASVQGFAKDVETFRTMATTKIEHAEWKALLDEFFPLPTIAAGKAPTAAQASERDNAQETRNRLSWAYEAAPGAMPGTRYGAYQAATYWLTHERGRPANRVEQNMLGESARLNRSILAHLLN